MEQQPCAPRVTLEHVVQRGHPLAGVAPVEPSAGVEPGDLDPVRLVHRAGAAANLAQRAIVVNHGDTVPRELQVELEAVAPLGQRCVERGERVLGMSRRGTTMSDHPGRPETGRGAGIVKLTKIQLTDLRDVGLESRREPGMLGIRLGRSTST